MLNSVFVLSKLSYDSPRYETVYLDYFDKWLITIRKREGILCQNAWANIYIYIYIYIFLGKQKVSRDQLTLPLKLSYSFYNIVYCLNRTFLSRSARKKFFWQQENVSSNWRKCFSWTWGHWIINLNYNPTLSAPPLTNTCQQQKHCKMREICSSQ